MEYKEQPLLTCKDCIHRQLHWFYGLDYKCNHAVDRATIDLVTGKKKYSTKFDCGYQRRENLVIDVCGPEGKYWSPKKKKDLFKLLKR